MTAYYVYVMRYGVGLHKVGISNTPGARVRELERTDGWEVSQRTGTSVWPATTYPYKEDAIARVMQLLDIAGPMWPQTWPERVEIANG